MEENKPIKQIMRDNCIMQYAIAKELGMHESSLSRKLRYGETEELRNQIIEAIKRIKDRPLVL